MRSRSAALCRLIDLFSGECRKLYHLSGLDCLPTFHALKVDAVARDRQRAMKIIELFRIELDGLLTAPTQTFRPGRAAEQDTLRACMLLKVNLYALVILWGL
ncbi:MAG: hypothetical protein H0W99_05300 [Acidobacteria bacterium]|nr:hypothetical protein [Acidobacteriota bacterium]